MCRKTRINDSYLNSSRRLFPHFRSFVCPFYPIVEDANALELGLLNLLDQYETLRDEKPGQLRSLLESSSAQLALFLSILALGAQFSHHSSSERVYQGQDLGDSRMPRGSLIPC